MTYYGLYRGWEGKELTNDEIMAVGWISRTLDGDVVTSKENGQRVLATAEKIRRAQADIVVHRRFTPSEVALYALTLLQAGRLTGKDIENLVELLYEDFVEDITPDDLFDRGVDYIDEYLCNNDILEESVKTDIWDARHG